MNVKYISIRKFGSMIGLSLLLAITSCDESEYLDQVPPTQVESADIFSTPARVESLVNGIYASVKEANFYGGRLLMFLDVRGEEFINITSNSFTGFDAWNHSYNSSSNDIINVWSIGYTTINRANIVIDGLSLPENIEVVGVDLAQQFIAEAKFLRALAYYTLVTAFARPYAENNGTSPGLPLRLQAETDFENNNLARSSVAEIYAQIIQDLDDAEANLPLTRSSASLNTTRAHRNTAIALKTRVYLNQGNWTGVIAEASKIVSDEAPFSATSGVLHALQSNIVALFESNYTSTESIFSMPFTNMDMLSGQSALGYLYNGNQEYFLNPVAILGNSQWTEDDARRGLLRYTSSNGRYWLAKFGQAAPYLRYIPVIRYSEVLLNYAEAAAESGNLELAKALLEAVHHRSGSGYEFPTSATATSAALVESIETERRIELLGEGFRSNDIMRRVRAFPEKVGPSFSTNAVQPSASNYIWPMSNNEILANNLILD